MRYSVIQIGSNLWLLGCGTTGYDCVHIYFETFSSGL